MGLTAIIAVPARAGGRTVTIDAGTIEGAVSGDGLSYKGIPHAAPPE